MNSSTKNKIAGLILAAGKSGRIGQPKAFLKFNQRTFIVEIILKISLMCDKIIVVFGYEGESLKTKLLSDKSIDNAKDKLVIVVNQDYELGMFSSIQCGLTEVNECDFVLIHQVDQPSLPVDFYNEFLNQIDEKFEWYQPSFGSKPGHPILISKKIVDKILSENLNSNLRQFKKRNLIKQKIWECSYPEIHQDIDTLEDYEKFFKDINYEHFRESF